MSYYFAIVGTQDNPLFEHEFGTSKQGGDGQSRFSEQARHLNQFILHSSLDMVEEVQWASGQMYLKIVDKFFNNYISCFLTPSNIKFLLLHQPLAPLVPSLLQPSPPSATAAALSASTASLATTATSFTLPGAGTAPSTMSGSTAVPPRSTSTPTGTAPSAGGITPGAAAVAARTASSSSSSSSIAANPTSAQTEEAIRSFFVEVYENYVKAVMNPFYRANAEIRSPVFRARVAAAGRKYL